MKKIFNLTSAFKAKDDENGNLTIRGMASTADIDRAGDVIVADAWKKGGLSNFSKNPIILFNHDYDKPIGRANSVEATDKGLELECTISSHAPSGAAGLIKDGVLGAFSVGFRIKDADYIEETGGLLIKDVELFEVSVVSVPCNQEATFSLAKSFDSDDEYEDFKKTFTHRVDLAGQSLAKEGDNSPNVARTTPDGAKDAHLENNMFTKEELEAITLKAAEKAAEAVAIKMAVKAAEAKTAEKAVEAEAAEKAAQAEEAKTVVSDSISKGIQSGTEKLMEDVAAQMTAKDADIAAVVAKFQADLDEKSEEIAKMQESKRMFANRDNDSAKGITAFGEDFMQAHLLGLVTEKGYNTDFARNIAEKAGVDYITDAADIDQEVSRRIEKEVQMYTKVADLFQTINVNGAATVLPIQPDANDAVWQAAAAPAGNLVSQTGGGDDAAFQPKQVILNAYRLISQTFLDNDIDEQVLISILPMLVDSVARAHAKAVERVILNGNGTIEGLGNYGAVGTNAASQLATSAAPLTAAVLMAARKDMGKYGISPDDVSYVVSMARYFELIEDAQFSDITDVGGLATKVKGSVGSVYGSNVIVSDMFAAEGVGVPVAYAVNSRNYAIPRLRGIKVEQDYEVGNQRRVVVASQALGFEELVGGYAANESAVKVNITA